MEYPRIICDPQILGGKPVIRGTRISVEFIVELVASGASRDDILKKYPQLTGADVEQALHYAAATAGNSFLFGARVAG
jgi:uncharacterized protein (DUF433 family)